MRGRWLQKVGPVCQPINASMNRLLVETQPRPGSRRVLMPGMRNGVDMHQNLRVSHIELMVHDFCNTKLLLMTVWILAYFDSCWACLSCVAASASLKASASASKLLLVKRSASSSRLMAATWAGQMHGHQVTPNIYAAPANF